MSGRFEILAPAGPEQLAVDRRGAPPRAVAVEPVPAEVADDPARLARLASEVEACARLFHPNVVAPAGLEGVGEALAVVRPYRDGASVRELLEGGGRLPLDLASRVAVDACAALAHVHARRGPDGAPLAHGALGPERVLVTAEGDAVITGFCAPHAEAGSPAADLRAIAAVVWECLAGEPPPTGRRALEAPGVPPPLAAAVARALAGEGAAEDLGRAVADAVAPAARASLAAYLDAIVPAGEGARGDRRRRLEHAIGSAVAQRPPRHDAGPEEVSEDLIVGEATPAPAPREAVADDLIVGEITPSPAAPAADAPAPAARATVASPAAAQARAAPPPAGASAPVAPRPAASPGPASPSAHPPAHAAAAPALAQEAAKTVPVVAPTARRSRGIGAVVVVLAVIGFAAGLAASRLAPWTQTASRSEARPVAAPARPAPAPAPSPTAPAATATPAAQAPAPQPPPVAEPEPEPEPEVEPAPPVAPKAAARPSIAVAAEPAGDVYLDGKKVGRAPITIPASRGAHEVRLRDPARFLDARRRVTVRGPATPVRFKLGKGWLAVSAPAAAEVFVNGRPVGRGDVKVELYEGEHRVEVRLSGAQAGERFSVAPGETWTYEVTPTPAR